MKKGFTLAEVLITLGIIGIVAALTMPVLISSHQKKVAVAGLKKFYSTLSQAKILAELENGEMDMWTLPNAKNLEEGEAFFNNYFRKHLNVISQCKSIQECNLYSASVPVYILNDGTEFLFAPNSSDSGLYGSYIYVKVDLNGNKRPNREGRDIFNLNIFPKTGVVMLGIIDVINSNGDEHLVADRDTLKNGVKINGGRDIACCNSTCSNTGYKYLTCGALIQLDGWEMKDDYPW